MNRSHAILAAFPVLALCGCSGGAPDTAAATAHPGLAAYVGKYPSDKVDGISWEKNRAVIDGVKATVEDPAVVAQVLTYTGPPAPIAMVDGKVVAGVCEARNCANHNWEILVDPGSGRTEVCYHDQRKTPGKSVWYSPGGSTEERDGGCSIS
ncbi:hypothetical protein RXV95_10165 [Novosphingobium sp. ZN18A2]|uniref:hypothetical protein n=1 Tax=Novosphingobium sp. ZN18A2 TaxID=3079861 RepID=UPI0030CFCB09